MSKPTITKATIEKLRQACAELNAPIDYAVGDIVTHKEGLDGLCTEWNTVYVVTGLYKQTDLDFAPQFASLFSFQNGEICVEREIAKNLRKLTQAELDALPDGEPAHDHNDPACN